MTHRANIAPRLGALADLEVGAAATFAAQTIRDAFARVRMTNVDVCVAGGQSAACSSLKLVCRKLPDFLRV